MKNADRRNKAAGFLAAAALAIALAPAPEAYLSPNTTIGDTLQALDMTVTGGPARYGYTVAMPVSGQAPAKPARTRQVHIQNKGS